MSETEIPTINVHTLKKLRDQDPKLHLIDVRETAEWEEMHIPGAVLIPKDTISQQIENITSDKETPIYLHCRSGMRSLFAAQCLKDMGYKNVYSVDGGIKDWAHSGYEVIR